MNLGPGKNIIIGLCLAAMIIPFLSRLPQEVVGEECWWISSGNAYLRLFLRGDFANPLWTNWKYSDWSWMNPQLGKYLVALPYHLSGRGEQEFKYFYRWEGKNLDWNREHNYVPPDNILRLGRLPGLIAGYFSCLLIYLIGRRINRGVGLMAAGYLALNPFFTKASVRAMNDVPTVFFSLVALYFLLVFNREIQSGRPSRRKLFCLALVTGIFIAGAISSKYIGGITLLFVGLYFLLISVFRFGRVNNNSSPTARSLILYFLILLLVVGLLFYALNPQFYFHPGQMLRDTLHFWHQHHHPDRVIRLAPHCALSNPAARVVTTNRLVFVREPTLNYHLRLSWSIELFLFLFGLISSLILSVGRLKTTHTISDRAIITAWTVVTFAIYYIWVPLSWSRFFLLVFITTPIFIASGISEIYHYADKLLKIYLRRR